MLHYFNKNHSRIPFLIFISNKNRFPEYQTPYPYFTSYKEHDTGKNTVLTIHIDSFPNIHFLLNKEVCMKTNKILYPFVSYLFVIFIFSSSLFAQKVTEGDPLPSVSPTNGEPNVLGKTGSYNGSLLKSNKLLQKVDKTFDGFWFEDNPDENSGFRFIPPDPIGAAGKNLLVAVVNSMIEARTKGGAFKWREGLFEFFSPLNPGSFPFDPKIVYDHYSDRFLVVALEQATGAASVDPNNISRILLAVSKNANPKNAADWRFQAINAKSIVFGSFEGWADYPGFEVDEEAVYITSNIFTFVPFGFYGGVRLWIADKGLYNGGSSAVNVYDPYALSGGLATTTMPAEVFGENGAGDGVGTYLVSYSGLTDGVDEYVQFVRVEDPLGTPAFFADFVNIGDIDDIASALPDAPQAGSAYGIEVNDRRALDAVWRDGYLWVVSTTLPNFGDEAGETTAFWVKLNTMSVPDTVILEDVGFIGGEDIAEGTFTFFPAVAVNRDGTAKFGFSASAQTIFAGAYVTGRTSNDPAGTVRSSEVIKEGEAPYKRFFGGTRNRWGDYSGIAVDPTNDDFVWVFNEYAAEPGSPSTGSQGLEDGRWGTAWGRAKFVGPASLGKSSAVLALVPEKFELQQNYPNPFNPTTLIEYALPKTSNVNLSIYNSLGQLVKTLISETKEEGFHTAVWDGTNQNGAKLASGMYIYKITTNNFVQSKKMILLK